MWSKRGDNSTERVMVTDVHPQTDGATCCTTGFWSGHASSCVVPKIHPLLFCTGKGPCSPKLVKKLIKDVFSNMIKNHQDILKITFIILFWEEPKLFLINYLPFQTPMESGSLPVILPLESIHLSHQNSGTRQLLVRSNSLVQSIQIVQKNH